MKINTAIFADETRTEYRSKQLFKSMVHCYQHIMLIVLLLCAVPVMADLDAQTITTLRYGMTSLPADTEQSRVWKLERSINLELARRAGLAPMMVECPFLRCQKDLELGRIDVLSLIVPNEARAKNQVFLSIWNIPNTYVDFYVRKGEEARLTTLVDLYDLRVGLVSGASYTSLFDHDRRINKTRVIKPIQLPKMLMLGRIDTFTTGQIPRSVLSEQYPNVVVAPIKYPVPPMALAAVGRHNERAQFIRPQLLDVLNDMIDEGVVERLFERYGFPAPELMVPPGIDWHLSSSVPDAMTAAELSSQLLGPVFIR